MWWSRCCVLRVNGVWIRYGDGLGVGGQVGTYAHHRLDVGGVGVVGGVVGVVRGHEAPGGVVLKQGGVATRAVVHGHGLDVIVLDGGEPEGHKHQGGHEEGREDGEDDERFFPDAGHELALHHEQHGLQAAGAAAGCAGMGLGCGHIYIRCKFGKNG